MVLRAVAVGVAFVVPLVAGCTKGAPVAVPLVVVVAPVSAGSVVTAVADPPTSTSRSTTEEVEVEWRGAWWPALVLERHDGNRWLVHYEGYGKDWDEVVGPERIRERHGEPEADEAREMEDEPDP